jgi:hypothetical protein
MQDEATQRLPHQQLTARVGRAIRVWDLTLSPRGIPPRERGDNGERDKADEREFDEHLYRPPNKEQHDERDEDGNADDTDGHNSEQ